MFDVLCFDFVLLFGFGLMIIVLVVMLQVSGDWCSGNVEGCLDINGYIVQFKLLWVCFDESLDNLQL